MMDDPNTTEAEKTDMPDIDPAIARDLARAMLIVDMTDPTDSEAHKAAWAENKTEALTKARKVLRRLSLKGITLTKDDAAT